MWLLDAHNSDHATGVPENIFRSIFYLCGQCGRYMTQRVSRDHHEPDDEIGCVNVQVRLANDLEAGSNGEKISFRVVPQEFPILSPLAQQNY